MGCNGDCEVNHVELCYQTAGCAVLRRKHDVAVYRNVICTDEMYAQRAGQRIGLRTLPIAKS